MELPKILYKFRTWRDRFHKQVLTKNELYMASPKLLNDPFDCRIPPDFLHLSDDEANQYITELAIFHFHEMERRGHNMETLIKNLEKRLKNKKKFQAEAEGIVYDITDKSYGVLSLTKIWNDILLWSHYANHHRGFCVGFWTEKLMGLGAFGRFGPIMYNTDFPYIKPSVPKGLNDSLSKAFQQTHTKSVNWKYEKEYRFTNVYEEVTNQSRTVHIPDDAFAEVILGLNISESDKGKIIKICRRKGIPVYQARKVGLKFRIGRKLIPSKSLNGSKRP